MRSIQEIIFSLMILVGLSMILYDVINVARTVERKNLLIKSRSPNVGERKEGAYPMKQRKLGSQVAPQGAASGARYSEAMMHLVNH